MAAALGWLQRFPWQARTHGPTALSRTITDLTWQRFLEPHEPVYALVAESSGILVGLAHYLFHRGTTRAECVCYLQDLFTSMELRGTKSDAANSSSWPCPICWAKMSA